MSRRRRSRRREPDSLANIIIDALQSWLLEQPWWVTVVVWLIPAIVVGLVIANLPGQSAEMAKLLRMLALAVLCVIPIHVLAVVVHKRQRARLVEEEVTLERLCALTWQEFEQLVGEAYRRKGYQVTLTGQGGPDGGVDLDITINGRRFLVQCKQYREGMVGEKVVRELKGIVATRRAYGGIVVTCGRFTSGAVSFAKDANIELIDGDDLVELVRDVRQMGVDA